MRFALGSAEVGFRRLGSENFRDTFGIGRETYGTRRKRTQGPPVGTMHTRLKIRGSR
jgi:hypothetical protein